MPISSDTLKKCEQALANTLTVLQATISHTGSVLLNRPPGLLAPISTAQGVAQLNDQAQLFATMANELSLMWDEATGRVAPSTDDAPAPDLPNAYTEHEAAEYLGVVRNDLRRLREAGCGPDYCCIKGKIHYGEPDLQHYAASL